VAKLLRVGNVVQLEVQQSRLLKIQNYY
jgi:hypothetical protein